jgi:hypothetical protein
LRNQGFAEKAVFMPNAVETPPLKSSPSKLTYKLIVPSGGHFVPIKHLEVFFDGFSLFTMKYPSINIDLTLIKGIEADKFVAFVDSYNLKQYSFIESQPREQLFALYENVDAVVDQFGYGLGLITLEGIARNKQVLCRFHKEYSHVYDTYPPVLDTATKEDVLKHLENLYIKKKIPKRNAGGRKWVQRNHSREAIRKIYTKAVKGVL